MMFLPRPKSFMKNNQVYIRHILEAIEKIEKYVRNETYESFMKNDMALDAVIRELGIIGEAAYNVDEKFQEENSQIPWGQMIGMRNRLVHEYFGVNIKVVWETCKNDLP